MVVLPFDKPGSDPFLTIAYVVSKLNSGSQLRIPLNYEFIMKPGGIVVKAARSLFPGGEVWSGHETSFFSIVHCKHCDYTMLGLGYTSDGSDITVVGFR